MTTDNTTHRHNIKANKFVVYSESPLSFAFQEEKKEFNIYTCNVYPTNNAGM